MSTSEMWTPATDEQQASFVGRHIGRSSPSGWTTRQIGYYDRHGNRIVRTWTAEGVMIETKADKTDIP
jgi:YD repeat-containing protein